MISTHIRKVPGSILDPEVFRGIPHYLQTKLRQYLNRAKTIIFYIPSFVSGWMMMMMMMMMMISFPI